MTLITFLDTALRVVRVTNCTFLDIAWLAMVGFISISTTVTERW